MTNITFIKTQSWNKPVSCIQSRLTSDIFKSESVRVTWYVRQASSSVFKSLLLGPVTPAEGGEGGFSHNAFTFWLHPS